MNIFLIFLNMKVCCVFSLDRADSNEYTQYTISNIKRKSSQIILNQQVRVFSMGLKNEIETEVVNEPSVFEPLKFYTVYNIPS